MFAVRAGCSAADADELVVDELVVDEGGVCQAAVPLVITSVPAWSLTRLDSLPICSNPEMFIVTLFCCIA